MASVVLWTIHLNVGHRARYTQVRLLGQLCLSHMSCGCHELHRFSFSKENCNFLVLLMAVSIHLSKIRHYQKLCFLSACGQKQNKFTLDSENKLCVFFFCSCFSLFVFKHGLASTLRSDHILIDSPPSLAFAQQQSELLRKKNKEKTTWEKKKKKKVLSYFTGNTSLIHCQIYSCFYLFVLAVVSLQKFPSVF